VNDEDFQEAMDFILASEASYRPVVDSNIELMRKTADWCGGSIKITDGVGPGGVSIPKRYYIKLNENDLAFAGDIIVRNGDEFRVFKEDLYRAVQVEAGMRLEIFQKVRDLVIEAMVEMREETKSGAGNSMNDVAEEITRKIIEIVG